ncbi:BtpA/SgcQ family protein [Acidianus manzaensis]|uniref:Photosystem I assembly BtpA n=1 Tax=Acidianus manzaensis TaxID=282676 RepID=A0A1W6JYQ6_9CREN|nr:BtpA/SgcQ family protein [Acidianus manzaensis]ARM75372.1 photosystem I assembly BtpA [Acidianus manzaensis]
MKNRPFIIGMIHLPPLPGSPKNTLSLEEIINYAKSEGEKLEKAGVDGVIVENLGDYPFFKDNIPPITIASMSIIVKEVRKSFNFDVGVNVLRNGCIDAFSIAHVTNSQFIRCNILIGAYVTDQGIIEGKAAELLRLKRSLNSNVKIFADIHVKHAYPLYNLPIELAAQDLAERGGADAVIVSGPRSSLPPSIENVKKVKESINLPVVIGSGISLENFRDFCKIADGLIIGEKDFKENGEIGGPSKFEAYKYLVEECTKIER